MSPCLLVGISDSLGEGTSKTGTATCVFGHICHYLQHCHFGNQTVLDNICLNLFIHFVNSHLTGNFGYCNYFLSTVCFYKVQQTFFQYICKNVHVCSIPLGIYCLETMEATMYSWVSWKACSFCKYFNPVNVSIFVEVCTKKPLK